LRQSEERYRTLFESIDEGFCVVEMLFDANDTPINYFLKSIPSSSNKRDFDKQSVKRCVS